MSRNKSIYIPISHGHSLNKINKGIKDFLSDEFIISDNKNSDLLIRHYIGAPPIGYKQSFLIQPMDGTLLNFKHLKNVNSYDSIIVPSTSSKKILENSGVSRPINIIPNWYDDEMLIDDTSYFTKRFSKKKYTFYNESTGIKRKNVENMLRYYISAFKDHPEKSNVRLIIKLSTDDNRRINSLRSFFINSGLDIVIINEFLSEEDLNGLRRGIDCYICLSYMEGFCIPVLNAAVGKKDIICLDSQISGYMDFLNEKNSRLVKCKKIQIDKLQESILIYDENSEWEEPIYLDYMEALIEVYKGIYQFDKNQDYSKYSKNSVKEDYLKLLGTRYYIISTEKNNYTDGIEISLNKICGNVQYNYLDSGLIESTIKALSNNIGGEKDWIFISQNCVSVIENSITIEEVLDKIHTNWDVVRLDNEEEFPITYIIKKEFIPRFIMNLIGEESDVNIIYQQMIKEKIGNWISLETPLVKKGKERKNKFFLPLPKNIQIIPDPNIKK